MLAHALRQIAVPFISLTIVIVGHGLATTYTTVVLHRSLFSPMEIGIIASMYYLGLVAGSFKIERFVARVGHIRAYAAFASIFTASIMLMPIAVNGPFWALLRLIYGYTIAGLFVVIESWFLTASDQNTRGQVLALYMISYYGAYSLGQYLLKLEPYLTSNLFMITAFLGAISVFPLATTRIDSPSITEPEGLNIVKFFRTSPSAVIGSFAGGLYTSVILSLLPLYIEANHYSSWVSYLMAIAVIGGMVFQFPIGKLSDLMDRRKILMISFLVSGLFSFFCYLDNPIESQYRELIFFTLGGITAVIYPISISLISDNVDSDKMIAAVQSMLLAYSIGCVASPVLAPLFGDESQIGIFLFMAIISFLCIIAISIRVIVNEPVPADEKQQYVPTAPIQTATAPELSPNVEQQEDSVYEQC